MAGIDSYTVLMLHCNGTDASTTFTDSSTAAHSMTANGNAQVDTAQSKFGGASLLLDGSGDSVTSTDSADWDFGTGDFTIDFWVRFNTSPSDYAPFDIGNGRLGNGVMMSFATSTIVEHWISGSKKTNITVSSISTGTWYHFAYVRTGSQIRLFMDGTQQGSDIADSTNITGSTEGATVGARTSSVNGIDGWLDEFRVSKGIARWTTTFTPPTSEYTSDSSKQLAALGVG